MRALHLTTIALLSMTGVAAHAQTPLPPADMSQTNGARPGHVPGVGTSLPLSNKASNIDQTDTKQGYAPTLPGSGLGADARPNAYLHVARDALAAGRTGQAQQALEMAETRLLDRSVVATQSNDTSANPRVAMITAAREALGHGDKSGAMQQIDAALAR